LLLGFFGIFNQQVKKLDLDSCTMPLIPSIGIENIVRMLVQLTGSAPTNFASKSEQEEISNFFSSVLHPSVFSLSKVTD
jgi:hypothetical protein